jgi:hypothetical protein
MNNKSKKLDHENTASFRCESFNITCKKSTRSVINYHESLKEHRIKILTQMNRRNSMSRLKKQRYTPKYRDQISNMKINELNSK